MLAVTAVSDSPPAAELDYARRFAARSAPSTSRRRRTSWIVTGTARTERTAATSAKRELMDVVSGHLDRLAPGARVATGTNADDLVAGFRPGIEQRPNGGR